MSEETKRRESNALRILAFLQSHGSATNLELNAICFRYGARLFELRQAGWRIETVKLEGGLFRFILKGHLHPAQQQQNLFSEAS